MSAIRLTSLRIPPGGGKDGQSLPALEVTIAAMPPSAAGETVLSPAGDSRLLASPTHSAVTMASMSSWSGPVSTAPASAPPPPVTPSKANRVLSSISFRVPGMSRSSSLRMKDLGSGAGFMHSDKHFLYLARRSYLHDDPSISKLNPSPEFMSKAQLQKLLRLEDCKRNLSKSPRVTRMKWMGADGLGGGIEAAETDQQRRARMMMSAQMQSAASAASWASSKLVSSPVFGASPPRAREQATGKKAGHKARKRGQGGHLHHEEQAFNEHEWRPELQAGCHILVHKRTGQVRSVNDLEDVLVYDGQLGTGALVYGKEEHQQVEELLAFLEGRAAEPAVK